MAEKSLIDKTLEALDIILAVCVMLPFVALARLPLTVIGCMARMTWDLLLVGWNTWYRVERIWGDQ